MNRIKKVARYGPGGRNCPCCGPAPKDRKWHDRMVKRRERAMTKREIEQEICYVHRKRNEKNTSD